MRREVISTEPRFNSQAGEYQAKKRRRRLWYRIVSALSCAVVFCTTYALILPALTMENPRVLDCPLVLHSHTADCYNEEGVLICGLADFVFHTHDASCYDADGRLVCPLPEVAEHVHTGDCYTQEAVLICGSEETAGHEHSKSCYAAERGDLICENEDEDHEHTDECYEQLPILTCGLEETAGHQHEESCYQEDTVPVCENGDEDHEHTDECFQQTQVLSCGLEAGEGAHTHTDRCHILTCGLEEGDGAHAHADGCYELVWTLTCGREERILHTHTDRCYDEDGALVCDLPETFAHAHTDECFRIVEESAPAVYAYEDETISVEVTLAENSAVPQNAVLAVRPITGAAPYSPDGAAGDDGYEDLVRRAEEAVGRTAAGILLYDISFYTPDGAYLPVEDSAAVSLRFQEAVFPEGTGGVTVLHYAEGGDLPAVLDSVDVERDGNDGVSAVTFETESFSTFGIMLLADEDEGSSFTLTYNDSTITFNLVDADGNPLSANCSDIAAEAATLYEFSTIAPTIDGYTYSCATYSSATVVSVATNGFTNSDGTVATSFGTAFQIYMDDPIVNGNWYSKNNDTVTLTYTKNLVLDGGTFAIINQSGGTNYALTTDSATVNDVAGLASQTVKLNSSNQVTTIGVTEWTFTKVEGTYDQYYISTTVDGATKYLTLCETPYDASNDGRGSLTLSNTPQAITAVVSGNTVTLHTGNDSTVNLDNNEQIFWCYNDWTSPSGNSQLLLAEVFQVGTVQGVTPTGTVINLFDYWAVYNGAQYDEDGNLTGGDYSEQTEGNLNAGINAGHFLKFTRNQDTQGTGTANAWTTTVKPLQGIVQSTLQNGVPVLTKGLTSGAAGSASTAESLAYLFDPDTANAYRNTYRNVGGLLQVDSQGYYYYDSRENFAELNADTKQFTLYDQGGVHPSGSSPEGQFFPFDSFADVAESYSGTDDVNHYFGMTMTTRFVHRHDGYTAANSSTPVIFEFAGDDDVWIFVDDVLVADLGGIHNRASVKIDFSTGEIIINEGTAYESNTTLYDMFAAAGKEDDVEWSVDTDGDGHSDTFANNTYHTLRFFYLERGNTDSNLHLKYNLASYPPTGITKVNQYGDAVSGAEFSVYRADANYNITNTIPVYTGVTDGSGQMVFVDRDNMPYTMDELENMFGEYFVLKETGVPPGYRLVSDEIHLHIQNSVPLCKNTWNSGVWADTNLLVSAPNTVKLATDTYNNSSFVSAVNSDGTENGTIFAVVLKYTGDDVGAASAANLSSKDNWAPLYGTAADGFIVLDKEKRADYISQLDPGGTGIMGYIEIPKIKCSLPIYHSTDASVLQIAIGHIEGSSLPVGGTSSHCVLSRHRGLPSAKLFTNLDQMETGDIFMLEVLDEVLTYEVDQILIVLPNELDALQIEEGQDYCTLVTCTPYGVNSHRLLVRGHRVENQEAAKTIRVTADAIQIEPLVVAPLVAVPMLLLLLVWLLISSGRKKRRKT